MRPSNNGMQGASLGAAPLPPLIPRAFSFREVVTK